ncbi:MAG: ABC transporter substrate-binding protein, partial [Cyanobacteria bacterium J06639_14]
MVYKLPSLRRRLRRLLLMALALTLAVAVANCGGPSETGSEAPSVAESAAPVDTRTLVFGSVG